MTDQPRATGKDLERAILGEARKVLEEEGYAALSTRRIASQVGCTATSIYLYFESKDLLVYRLIEEGFEELNRRILEAIDGPGDLVERLAGAARAYVDFGLERTPYYEIMFMLRADQMERFPIEAYRRARATLDSFGDLLEIGERDARRIGTTIWASLHGLVALIIAKRIDVRIDTEKLIDHAVRSVCGAAIDEKHRRDGRAAS